MGGGVGSGGGWVGGRVEGVRVDMNEQLFFVKNSKKSEGVRVGGSGWGCQGGSERSIEETLQIKKIQGGGGSGREGVGFGGSGWM